MPDHHGAALADRVADLEATVAAQRADLAALRRRAEHRAVRRPPARLLAACLTVLLAIAPLGLAAANFVDLNPGSDHNGNIAAIADAGISKGCVDTQHYCPNDFVTREQMASFLARTAGLGANPPVANAARLNGKRADELLRVALVSTEEYVGQGAPFTVPGGAAFPTFAPMRDAAITIQAPADGFVLVTAVVWHSEAANERLYARLRDTTPGRPADAVSHLAFAANGNDPARAQLALTWVFPVSGAGTKAFALELAQGSATVPNDVFAYNATLTALYLPFGYDGGTSLAP